MRQISILMMLAIAGLVFFTACDKDKEMLPEQANTPDVPDSLSEDEASGDSTSDEEDVPDRYYPTDCANEVVELYAGQDTEAGQLTISNDQEYLYVTFETNDGWKMPLTHLYAGTKEGLPATPSGNPQIGNFPYGSSHDPATSQEVIRIPLSELPDDECIVVAAHAEVVQYDEDGEVSREETAWSAGDEITQGGSWATYTDYCVCDDNGGGAGGN